MFGVNKFETYLFASGSGVAQIGNTTYASLQEAFDAVPEDGTATTVTLTNIEMSETSDIVTLENGKNITLDMNAKVFTFKEDASSSPALAGRAIINNGNLTIKETESLILQLPLMADMAQLITMVL